VEEEEEEAVVGVGVGNSLLLPVLFWQKDYDVRKFTMPDIDLLQDGPGASKASSERMESFRVLGAS
jgi:hypothetical protein